MLAGIRLDDLDAGDLVDVAEAALLEPVLNGAMVDVDRVLRKLEDVILEAMPDRETWGTSEQAQEGAAAAEAMFGAAPPRGES